MTKQELEDSDLESDLKNFIETDSQVQRIVADAACKKVLGVSLETLEKCMLEGDGYLNKSVGKDN